MAWLKLLMEVDLLSSGTDLLSSATISSEPEALMSPVLSLTICSKDASLGCSLYAFACSLNAFACLSDELYSEDEGSLCEGDL